jgi:predicted DNA-binding transcriptional regulator YafY
MEVAGTGELTTWILSFGGKCEVLEPPRLRDDVATELRRALAPYAS